MGRHQPNVVSVRDTAQPEVALCHLLPLTAHHLLDTLLSDNLIYLILCLMLNTKIVSIVIIRFGISKQFQDLVDLI